MDFNIPIAPPRGLVIRCRILAVLVPVAFAAGLLVGAACARALAWALDVPAIGAHHMEGHLLAPLLDKRLQGVDRGIRVPMVMATGVDQMNQIPRQRIRS